MPPYRAGTYSLEPEPRPASTEIRRGWRTVDISSWIGSATEWLDGRADLYQEVEGNMWAAVSDSVPLTPLDAIKHIVEYLEWGHDTDWSGAGMAMVARAYGAQEPLTRRIPREILGYEGSAARQYRWLNRNRPELTVPAFRDSSFGYGVPLGAILYWDEGRGGSRSGSVGIAAGYRNGILMQFCSSARSMTARRIPAAPPAAAGPEAPDVTLEEPQYPVQRSVVLRAAPRNGALGWTLPVFYAPPDPVVSHLWDEPPKEVSEEDDRRSFSLLPINSPFNI